MSERESNGVWKTAALNRSFNCIFQCMLKKVCVNISSWFLPCFLLFFIFYHHTHSYLLTKSSSHAPPNPIHPLPALVLQPAASPPPSLTSFSLPLSISWDRIPSGSVPPPHSASWCYLSSRPVWWCEILPKPDTRKFLIPGLYMIFFVYTSRL